MIYRRFIWFYFFLPLLFCCCHLKFFSCPYSLLPPLFPDARLLCCATWRASVINSPERGRTRWEAFAVVIVCRLFLFDGRPAFPPCVCVGRPYYMCATVLYSNMAQGGSSPYMLLLLYNISESQGREALKGIQDWLWMEAAHWSSSSIHQIWIGNSHRINSIKNI